VVDPCAFPAVALDAICTLIPCTVASFNDVDPEAGRLVALLHPSDFLSAEEQSYYAETLAALVDDHPLIRHHLETGDGSAVKFSDFLSAAQLHELPVYQQVYRPLRVEHQMSITLPAALPRIVGIALNREDRDFDERERALLNALRPHLAQSYQSAQERVRAHRGMGTLTAVLREQGTQVLMLDETETEVSSEVAALLSRYFGRTASGALPAEIVSWLRINQGRADVGLAGPLPLAPLAKSKGARALIVRYVPDIHGAGTLLFHERPVALGSGELKRLGLTARETQIMQHLSQGASDGEIAARLHIAYGTTRKHLDNIYRKLGVTSRTQAVATAFELLPAERLDGRDN
jgi:DNA-binding CsgD family transcriptional regulator